MNAQINPQDPIPSISIESLLRRRQAAMERYTKALELIREADEMKGLGCACFVIKCAGGFEQRVKLPEETERVMDAIRKNVDSTAWAQLMNDSGLRTFLDKQARQEWDSNIHEGKVPELTGENIHTTFATIHAKRQDYFDRGVVTAFRRLSWNYKTNQPFKFGKRIIMNSMVSIWGNKKEFVSTSHTACNELDDLVRIFCFVDGKPEPDHRNSMHYLMSGPISRKEQFIDTDYFSMRWFYKGTGHVTFKRPELVDALNSIIAKHYPGALAAPRE